MAIKNSRKIYVEDGYYHIYNRGVEKRLIFQDEQEYGVFLSYLKVYLSPTDTNDLSKRLKNPQLSAAEKHSVRKLLQLNNFSEQISLLAYCLMPNHFHLFIKQHNQGSINQFMNSLCTRYVMYFNRKNKRVGPLFQSRYKAVLISSEAQYLHISRYIHKQALAGQGDSDYAQPSSYPEYIGARNTEWVHPEEILSFFSNTTPSLSYERFVSEYDSFQLESDDLD
jgi:putative transposase